MKKWLVLVLVLIFSVNVQAAEPPTRRTSPRPYHTYLSRELNAYMEQFGHHVSVYYENLETGFVYTYNADRVYYSASLIKAPYIHYLYETLSDLDAEHTYTTNMRREGGGVIKRMENGTVLTEAQLLEYSIRVSDNVAFRMLVNKYGTEGFKDWVAKNGGRTHLLKNVTGADMTVKDAGFFTKLIYNYIESSQPHSEKFKSDLITSAFPYIDTRYPFAHKYGLWDHAFHDMGIVYAESPYILVIMTDMGDSIIVPTKEAKSIVREISRKVQDANERVKTSGFAQTPAAWASSSKYRF